MNLILCHTDDREAIWLYTQLKKRDVEIELLSPEQLMMSEEWTQYVETESDSYTIKTKTGISIHSNEKHFLFNRTRQANAPIWHKSSETEKTYAASEMNAMVMGWLYQVQLKNILYNPPMGYSLSGAYWSKPQWTKAALSAGFEVVDSNHPEPQDKLILVVDNEVVGSKVAKKTEKRAVALSSISNTPFLQIRLRAEDENFKDADSFPTLRTFGSPLVDLLKNKIHEA